MTQQTQRYKRTLKGSIGAGVQSVLGSDRRFYILEHKISSKYHKAGENQQIIVDQIELGRASTCQVRFDESFTTVSRRHAAIVRDGDNWKLVQLSQTNSTFLNGHQVQKEWYLQNGDEIQLSVNGPKMGFITPSGKKGTVGSLGLTRRLSLFGQQALRPYKYAITALSACLVLAIVGLGGWNWKLHEDLRNQSLLLAEQIIKNKDNKEVVDSLAKKLAAANEKIAAADDKIKKIKKYRPKTVVVRTPVAPISSKEGSDIKQNHIIESCYPYTYFVECGIIKDGEYTPAWSGTGFLLSNGYFVTAQHVVHWDGVTLIKDKNDKIIGISPDGYETNINVLYYSNQVKIAMNAVSYTGDKIHIEYSYQNCPFRTGRSKMNQAAVTDEAGRSWVVKRHEYEGDGDWAYVKVNKSGGLPFDATYSKNMPPMTKLTILGFPANMDQKQNGKYAPDVSEAVTSRQGVEDAGWIRASNSCTDHGNSGGPVFALRNGKPTVVGILSGVNFGSNKAHWRGRIIPIGAAF